MSKPTAPLRIVTVADPISYPNDQRVQRDMEALAKSGDHVTVITQHCRGQPWKEMQNSVRIYRVAVSCGDRANHFLLGFLYASIVLNLVTIWVWLRHGLDVLCIYNLPNYIFVVARLIKAERKTIIYSVLNLAPELYGAMFGNASSPLSNLLVRLERLSCQLADHIIVANESYRCAMMDRYHVPADKISLDSQYAPLTRLFSLEMKTVRPRVDTIVVHPHETRAATDSAQLQCVDILGVRVVRANDRQILECANEWVASAQRRTILYVNAHCMNIANIDHSYKAILNNADLVYADGIGIVWASRFLNGCKLQRATLGDWIERLCECAESGKWRIYILGGKRGIAIRAREKLVKKWPGLNVVGVHDGFFGADAEQEILNDINRASPHILFVGMGTPKQENWIAANRDQISAPICWAVGALFDYIGGTELRSPALINHIGFEWLWRLMVDPRGKWRRYILGNPVFVYRVLQYKYALRRSI